jgi:hypothetical protein
MPSSFFSFTSAGDLLDQPRLVHLVRNLGDDDRLAVLADFSMAALARIFSAAAAAVKASRMPCGRG